MIGVLYAGGHLFLIMFINRGILINTEWQKERMRRIIKDGKK